jgi:hypothetical protein
VLLLLTRLSQSFADLVIVVHAHHYSVETLTAGPIINAHSEMCAYTLVTLLTGNGHFVFPKYLYVFSVNAMHT